MTTYQKKFRKRNKRSSLKKAHRYEQFKASRKTTRGEIAQARKEKNTAFDKISNLIVENAETSKPISMREIRTICSQHVTSGRRDDYITEGAIKLFNAQQKKKKSSLRIRYYPEDSMLKFFRIT